MGLGSRGRVMGITYQKERFEDIISELPELFHAHYQEFEEDKENLPLDIDWMRCLRDELSGILHIMTARRDGKLIGYFFAYIQSNWHHAKTRLSASDSIYVLNLPHRAFIWRKLINETQKMCRDLGAKKLYIIVKAGSPAARLLNAMKLKLTEEVYSCLL